MVELAFHVPGLCLSLANNDQNNNENKMLMRQRISETHVGFCSVSWSQISGFTNLISLKCLNLIADSDYIGNQADAEDIRSS